MDLCWQSNVSAFQYANLLQLCLTLCGPIDYSPPGSSVLGILQARILEWVAISSSRGSSPPREGGKGDDRGWDGWMASRTQWTWVWVNCGSWWWTGRPGMLRFVGLQRVGHDWVTELNWTKLMHGYRRAVWKILLVMEMFWILTATIPTSLLSYCSIVLENVTTGWKVAQVTWAIIFTTICESKITS